MKGKTVYMFITASLGWLALLLQFYLILNNDASGISFGGRFINFFSYFTISTNIAAAFSLTAALSNTSSGIGQFFSRPSVHTAIAMYILIVGIVYVSILQGLWQPQGLNWIADIALHYVTPILYTVYWLVFVPKGSTRWAHCLLWLVYPGIYFIYSIVRGSFSGWYPYPFLNVGEHGLQATLFNALIFLAGFIIAGLIFIGLDKMFAKSAEKN